MHRFYWLIEDVLAGCSRPGANGGNIDRDLESLEEELSDRLGTTVAIRPGRKGSGQLIVRYGSLEHLDTLLAKLRG